MPSLEDIESDNPSPLAAPEITESFLQKREQEPSPFLLDNKQSQPKQEEDNKENEELQNKQQAFNASLNYNESQIEDVFYPKIKDYLPNGKYSKEATKYLNYKNLSAEDYEKKVTDESEKIKKYLENLFPEKLENVQEEYDSKNNSQKINPEKQQEKLEKKIQELSDEIGNLEKEKWTVSKLIVKLRNSYHVQSQQMSKIDKLKTDNRILIENLKKKDKKIQEIQKILRDLNEYKVAYLDLNNVDKVEQLDLSYRQKYTKEIEDLKSKIEELTGDRENYKQKYTVFREKYETIFNEAKEAKVIFQEQVKEFLNLKKEYLSKYNKFQEDIKQKLTEDQNPNKKNSQVEHFQNKISRSKNRFSGVNSPNSAFQDDTQSVVSQQTISPYMNNQNQAPSNNQFSQSQFQQQQFQNQQSQQYPFYNQNPLVGQAGMNFNISNMVGQNNELLLGNPLIPNPNLVVIPPNENTSPQQIKSPNEWDSTEPISNISQQQNQDLLLGVPSPLLVQQATAQFSSEQAQEKGNQNFLQQQQPQLSGFVLSDHKKMKKAQVQFEDLIKQAKTKEQEEEEYHNQQCAKKIKNMIKGIQQVQPLLLEESILRSTKRYGF